jgi:hypothetical protein
MGEQLTLHFESGKVDGVVVDMLRSRNEVLRVRRSFFRLRNARKRVQGTTGFVCRDIIGCITDKWELIRSWIISPYGIVPEASELRRNSGP